jgi:hypothetical protein
MKNYSKDIWENVQKKPWNKFRRRQTIVFEDRAARSTPSTASQPLTRTVNRPIINFNCPTRFGQEEAVGAAGIINFPSPRHADTI